MYSKIIFFIWLFAITFISLVDYSSMSLVNLSNGFGSGFWLHIIGYFIAGALYLLAFGNKRQRVVLVTFFVLFLLGVLFEIVQIYVPHRTFNPKDIAANGLGLAGVYVGHQLFGRRETAIKD
ncbi:MAG: VanZ family protein [Anaerolineales bacterium]|nr:VanZ family protein [Anaerolineales bacterium]